MTQVSRLPSIEAAGTEIATANGETARLFTGMIDAMEQRGNQQIDVLSHAQVVSSGFLISTLLVRRPASAADPRRN